MRTIVDIPAGHITSLDRISNTENRSRASVVREAIAEYLTKRTEQEDHTAFGIWKQNPKDSLQVQKDLRREWEVR